MTPESPSYKDVGVCQHSETAIAFNFLKLLSDRNSRRSGIGLAVSLCLVELQGKVWRYKASRDKEAPFAFIF